MQRIINEIDGIEYCKTLKGVGGRSFQHNTKGYYILYININDPNDVKRGNLGVPMLVLTLGFIAVGILLVWFGFHQKKSIEKKQGIRQHKMGSDKSKL